MDIDGTREHYHKRSAELYYVLEGEGRVVLDGVEQPHYVYWVGNKVLHQGAPSNPIDFLPTTP